MVLWALLSFSCQKISRKFISEVWLFWSVILFVLPMAISSPSYIIHTYHDWYGDLAKKNMSNIGPSLQDISLMGLIRNIFNVPQVLSNIPCRYHSGYIAFCGYGTFRVKLHLYRFYRPTNCYCCWHQR